MFSLYPCPVDLVIFMLSSVNIVKWPLAATECSQRHSGGVKTNSTETFTSVVTETQRHRKRQRDTERETEILPRYMHLRKSKTGIHILMLNIWRHHEAHTSYLWLLKL